MATKALGLIEVRGLLCAITATDAALKAADVRLINNQTIRGGLTTIELYGDVAAVTAAVEAGVDSLSNSDNLISSHVIARLDEQVERMIFNEIEKKKHQKTQQNQVKEVEASHEEERKDQSENSNQGEEGVSGQADSKLEATTVEHDEQVLPVVQNLKDETKADSTSLTQEELKKMKVTQLRSLAYKSNVKGIEKAEIKFANKEKLVEVLKSEGGIN